MNVFPERPEHADIPYGDHVSGRNVFDFHPARNCLSSESRPCVFLMHGGGWYTGAKHEQGKTILPLLEWGYHCVTTNYRFAQHAPYPAALEDCFRSLQTFLEMQDALGVSCKHVILMGISAGAYLALRMGIDPRLQELKTAVEGVVAICPAIDIEEAFSSGWADRDVLWGDFFGHGNDVETQKRRRDASIKGEALERMPSLLLIHGTEDDIVPYAHAHCLSAQLEKRGRSVSLCALQGRGHALSEAETLPLIKRFLLDEQDT